MVISEFSILNLDKLSGRKGSADSKGKPRKSPKARKSGTGMTSYVYGGRAPSSSEQVAPVELDRTKFETQFTYSDNLKVETFDGLRRLIAKRKE